MLQLKTLVPGSEEWLHQAVNISVFTEARAHDSEAADAQYRGGCWDDMFLPTGMQRGSRLWLLRRSVLTQSTLNKAHDMLKEALSWLIPTYANSMSISVSRAAPAVMQFVVVFHFTRRTDVTVEVLYAV